MCVSGPTAGHRDEMIDSDGMAESDRTGVSVVTCRGVHVFRPVILVCNVDVLVCNLEQVPMGRLRSRV